MSSASILPENGILERIRRYLGSQAMVNVPDFLVRLVGVRHQKMVPDENFKFSDCPTVHRSFDDWWGCVERQASELMAETLTRMSPETRARCEAKAAAVRAEWDAKIRSLRW